MVERPRAVRVWAEPVGETLSRVTERAGVFFFLELPAASGVLEVMIERSSVDVRVAVSAEGGLPSSGAG